MATINSNTAVRHERHEEAIGGLLEKCVQLLGSLKLTVVLFAFSLVIVLVGTLAQDEMNMLEVKQRYFLSWIARLHFDDFFPQAFVPHSSPFWGVIPFPGGSLIGVLLMINLVCAKVTRFRVHAGGGRLAAGIGFLMAGCVTAGLIIQAGHSSDGLQGNPPFSYDLLWTFVLAGLAALNIGCVVAAARARPVSATQILAALAGLALACFLGYSLYTGWRIGDPGLRIVWQLTKGLGAGVILLIGCRLVF
ncbi:MAG: cytochrome C biogenesis protein, partial [Pirellulales bacterium]|nr:cytochrome C biogenesis protein [Pirellulales bacterium]